MQASTDIQLKFLCSFPTGGFSMKESCQPSADLPPGCALRRSLVGFLRSCSCSPRVSAAMGHRSAAHCCKLCTEIHESRNFGWKRKLEEERVFSSLPQGEGEMIGFVLSHLNSAQLLKLRLSHEGHDLSLP